MKVTCDNVIFIFESVSMYEWDNFRHQLEIAETFGRIPRVKFYIGQRISEYHYNLQIGQGAGAMHIGYKHNSAKEHREGYNMRIEVNPSKKDSGTSGTAQEWLRELLAQCFVRNKKTIKGIDIAFDIPIPKNRLMVASMTGKERSLIKGTEYYGTGGRNGRLKIYDKKTELKQKQGIEIEEEHLTRIEYSARLVEPVTMQFFGSIGFSMNEEYQISELKLEQNEGVIKACLIAVNSGGMSLNEFSRRYKEKIKKAMEETGLLDLDHEYSKAKREILTLIKRYLAPTQNNIIDHHLNSKTGN